MRISDLPTLAAVIKDRREQLGWSQAALAAESGTSRAWISRIENGQVDARVTTVVAILSALRLQLAIDLPTAAPSSRSSANTPDAGTLDAIIAAAIPGEARPLHPHVRPDHPGTKDE